MKNIRKLLFATSLGLALMACGLVALFTGTPPQTTVHASGADEDTIRVTIRNVGAEKGADSVHVTVFSPNAIFDDITGELKDALVIREYPRDKAFVVGEGESILAIDVEKGSFISISAESDNYFHLDGYIHNIVANIISTTATGMVFLVNDTTFSGAEGEITAEFTLIPFDIRVRAVDAAGGPVAITEFIKQATINGQDVDWSTTPQARAFDTFAIEIDTAKLWDEEKYEFVAMRINVTGDESELLAGGLNAASIQFEGKYLAGGYIHNGEVVFIVELIKKFSFGVAPFSNEMATYRMRLDGGEWNESLKSIKYFEAGTVLNLEVQVYEFVSFQTGGGIDAGIDAIITTTATTRLAE